MIVRRTKFLTYYQPESCTHTKCLSTVGKSLLPISAQKFQTSKGGFDSILVRSKRLSTHLKFQHFFLGCFSKHGIPVRFISDRHPKFTANY